MSESGSNFDDLGVRALPPYRVAGMLTPLPTGLAPSLYTTSRMTLTLPQLASTAQALAGMRHAQEVERQQQQMDQLGFRLRVRITPPATTIPGFTPISDRATADALRAIFFAELARQKSAGSGGGAAAGASSAAAAPAAAPPADGVVQVKSTWQYQISGGFQTNLHVRVGTVAASTSRTAPEVGPLAQFAGVVQLHEDDAAGWELSVGSQISQNVTPQPGQSAYSAQVNAGVSYVVPVPRTPWQFNFTVLQLAAGITDPSTAAAAGHGTGAQPSAFPFGLDGSIGASSGAGIQYTAGPVQFQLNATAGMTHGSDGANTADFGASFGITIPFHGF